jgi:hypothetical protein
VSAFDPLVHITAQVGHRAIEAGFRWRSTEVLVLAGEVGPDAIGDPISGLGIPNGTLVCGIGWDPVSGRAILQLSRPWTMAPEGWTP